MWVAVVGLLTFGLDWAKIGRGAKLYVRRSLPHLLSTTRVVYKSYGLTFCEDSYL